MKSPPFSAYADRLASIQASHTGRLPVAPSAIAAVLRSLGPAVTGFWCWLAEWVDRAWVAYPLLLLLQLKVIWGDWKYRDLTFGDTSSYFLFAYTWYEQFGWNVFLWSPLYTAFYGTLLHLSSDVYLVTTLHRLVIVFVVSGLVLALMRRLLPHGIAWLIAAWWTLLHANFNALYEVHLFALIPVVLAPVLILSGSGPWARGAALAAFMGTTFLVRNEYILATALLAAVSAWWEILTARRLVEGRTAYFRYCLVAYTTSILVVGLVIGFFYAGSGIKYPEIQPAARDKAAIAFCQLYAVGYQQRHPEWTKNPYTECQELMEQDFGRREMLSVFEAMRSNPAAVLTHVAWNVSLVPSAIQVLLFNATSGSVNPDLAPVPLEDQAALLLSIATVLMLIMGGVQLFRWRRYWWEAWLRDRAWGWAVLISLVGVAAVVTVTARPRPEYIYGLSLLLMAATGMSLAVVAAPWLGLRRIHVAAPALIFGALLLAPGFYSDPAHVPPRRLLEEYRRLTPFADLIASRETVFLKGEFTDEVMSYIGHGTGMALGYGVLAQRAPGTAIAPFLENQGVTLFYLDENLLRRLWQDPGDQSFLVDPESEGWKLRAWQNGGSSSWMLLQKMVASDSNSPERPALPHAAKPSFVGFDLMPSSAQETSTQAVPEIARRSEGFALGRNWYGLETMDGETFRWVANDAELLVAPNGATAREISLELEPGPGVGSQSFALDVFDVSGQKVATTEVRRRQTLTIPLPQDAASQQVLRLHLEGGGLRAPNDARTLNFRVFGIGWASDDDRYDVQALSRLNASPDIGPADARQTLVNGDVAADGLYVGRGWHPYETFEDQSFRWVADDAEVVVTSPTGAKQEVQFEVEPGPGVGSQPFSLQVLDESNQLVASVPVRGRQLSSIVLAIKANTPTVFKLHVDGGGHPTPNDPRVLNFRIFGFGWADTEGSEGR